jgi:hypothetical protein
MDLIQKALTRFILQKARNAEESALLNACN